MHRTLTAALFASVLAIPASAHITDEDEFSRPVVFDCSAMTGQFGAGGKRVVTIIVAEAKVTFTLAGKPPVVGDCIAPLIADGDYYPRALAKLDASFGAKFDATEYAMVHLKGDELLFDKAGVEAWRRKP